jgi:circadian clock protein KaiC
MSEMRSIPCCIEGMDEILGGFKSPAVILVAGTTGVGKTTMGLQMLANAAKQGEKTLYIPLTTETPERFGMFLSTFEFLGDSVKVHQIKRQTAEKDPLSTLIEIGNVVSSVKPDRLVIDPVTPIGFGFVEQERRRFFYTLDSMVRESDTLVFLDGEVEKPEIHGFVVSHLADGIIYLSRANRESGGCQELEILKMTGVEPPYSPGCMNQKFNYSTAATGFRLFPELKYEDNGKAGDVTSSGIEELDKMLGNKFLSGTTLLIAGKPGSGKTVFGWQFINKGLELGEKCLILTFYETAGQTLERNAAFGRDFKKHIDSGNLIMVNTDMQGMCPAKYAGIIKEYVEKEGIKRLFLDGLPNIELAVKDEMKLRSFLHSLAGYLGSRGVTSLFTTELMGGGWSSIRSMEASFVMDIVLLLEQREEDKAGGYFRVMKARGIPGDMTLKGYSIGKNGMVLE